MNIKQKTKVRTRQATKDIFSNVVGVNELLVLVYPNQDDNAKSIKRAGTIYELRIIKKALLRIKTSLSRERTSMTKKCFLIRYKTIRKNKKVNNKTM